MPIPDQQKWNERYATGEFGYREPDAFVIDAHHEFLQPLLPAGGDGLDLAGGAGHHAVWLMQQGWRMMLADFSQTALDIARSHSNGMQLEIRCGAALNVVQALIAEKRQFRFVLVSFFLDRTVLPWLPELLAPEGLLLYRTYTVDNLRFGNQRGPREPERLLRSQELLTIFSSSSRMRILHYHETVKEKGVVELIAQRS